MKNEIIIFENQNVKLEVNMQDETVWLSLEQMSKLFDRDRTVITRHINNILKSKELSREEVCAKFAHTTKHGAIQGKLQTRELDYYNLDMIISVGYRVNSKQGVEFRKWATKVLKDYLVKGYAVNNKRLEYLEKTIKLIDIAGRMDKELKGDDAKEIIKVINNYSKALNLLDGYDHRNISRPNGTKNNNKISYEDCIDIISKLKFTSDSNLFAVERNEGLKEIIGAIYQSFDGFDLYPSIEEKGANFLYLITKNHTFIDGNKRIAATLFIYFLEFYNLLYRDNGQVIDNNTLVAITLLIAQSDPREKDILIDLVMNFLKDN
ncbi:MAG: virulence protein RhuM/Fic/DOC family protein [Bacilli bacterium]|nr:virulence protein RhuM/Fic/DOC family protein [Bacilli bacterium]